MCTKEFRRNPWCPLCEAESQYRHAPLPLAHSKSAIFPPSRFAHSQARALPYRPHNAEARGIYFRRAPRSSSENPRYTALKFQEKEPGKFVDIQRKVSPMSRVPPTGALFGIFPKMGGRCVGVCSWPFLQPCLRTIIDLAGTYSLIK